MCPHNLFYISDFPRVRGLESFFFYQASKKYYTMPVTGMRKSKISNIDIGFLLLGVYCVQRWQPR